MGDKRVPALDGVRGLAILVVLGDHAGITPGGWVGVSLFFALSGYLITGLLIGENDRSGTIALRGFYRRRFARLAPALGLALVGMVMLWATTRPQQTNLAVTDAVLTLAYVANIARAFAPVTMIPASWAWSLSIEEQFYLLWPVTLRAALRRVSRNQLAAVLAGLAALLMASRLVVPGPDVLYNLVRGDELLLGSAVALTTWRPSPRLLPLGLLLLGGLLLVPAGHFEVSITLATLGGLSVLLLAERGWFSLRPLQAFGRISYSLYLWNGILVAWWYADHQLSNPRGWDALAVTVLSVLLATASTLLVEEPLRRRLAYPRPRTGAAVAPVPVPVT